MGWMHRMGRIALAGAIALAVSGCGGGGGEVQPLAGMEPMVMREMATEAYSMWDPASVQLVDLDLLRGHRVDDSRYDLDIRYTVRKTGEPTRTSHAALAQASAASPDPEIAAQAPKLRALADTEPGGTVEFTETIVLVPYRGAWMPKRWRENEVALQRRAAAPAGAAR